MISDAFLQRMDPKYRKELVAGLEEQLVRGLNLLRGEVKRIIPEREADRDLDKSSRQSTPHCAPPVLSSIEQAASDVREAPDIYSTMETCDNEYEDGDEDRLWTAFASSSKSGSLSYLRANKKLCTVLSEQLGDISLTEDIEELASEALLAEIPSNTNTIDEKSFMRAGTVLIMRMKVSGYQCL